MRNQNGIHLLGQCRFVSRAFEDKTSGVFFVNSYWFKMDHPFLTTLVYKFLQMIRLGELDFVSVLQKRIPDAIHLSIGPSDLE